MYNFFLFFFGLLMGIATLATVQNIKVWQHGSERRECGYIPHPISDVAWELYDRSQIPAGTALYYTRMVNSANIPAAECIEAQL